MKTKTKVISVVLALAFILSAFTQAFAYDAEIDTITASQTPCCGSLKWAAKIGNGWQKPAGVPIIAGDNIVIMSGDEIYALDRESGDILLTAQMSESQDYGYTPLTYADGKIFAPLSSGTVEAFDGDSLSSLWTYNDELGGQALTKVTYSDGLLFTGFWNDEDEDASFVCLDAQTGEKLWSKTVPGGLYWAGAACIGDAVVFGTDDGVVNGEGTAYIYSLNKRTGEEIGKIEVAGKGDIRSSVAYDGGRIYLTTKGGYIVSAKVDGAGVITDVSYGEVGAASVSTPCVYKGVIYIGASDKSVKAIDAQTLETIYSVPMNGYPQCTLLLSTAYEESDGYIYLYATYNAKPGGITLIKAKPDAKSADECIVKELYNAEGYEQYCVSSIISDENGVLYYKNDSGYLFAVEQKAKTVSVLAEEEGFILPKRTLSVPVGIAERYGYVNIDIPEGEISALDVLVKTHEEMFDEFTPKTAADYLIVDPNSGYISRIFGIDTYNLGFSVNGKAPHDDVLTDYGYTGYTVSQAEVKEGDVVAFYLYRDAWAMDNLAYFTLDGEKTDALTVARGDEVTLDLKGYVFAYYSCSDEAAIDSVTTPLSDAIVSLVDEKTGEMTPLDVTDENGSVTLSFDNLGTYVISATENPDDEYMTPIIAPWLEVTVGERVKAVATEDGFIFPQTALVVEDGTAEKYGYVNLGIEDDAISALDVLVKTHEEMFDEFTPKTAADYLIVDPNSGYISRIFGIDTYNLGFSVNGKAPHDDVLTDYGYTGYTVSQAEVKEGDVVAFYLYRDAWAMDNLAYFTLDGEKTDALTVARGDEVTLDLKGYVFAYYSCSDEAAIDSVTTPLSDAIVSLVDEKTGEMTPLDVTDEDGSVTLSFEKPGRYIVSATEDPDDEYMTPIIAPWLEINVLGINVETEGDTVYIYSNLEESVSCMVIAAAYEDDAMTGVIKEDVILPEGEGTLSLDISDIAQDNIKIFIIDGALRPLI